MRYLVFFLIFLCPVTYVLFDSRALEFKETILESTGTIERVASVPVFHSDRLVRYFEKLVHGIGK